MRIAIGQLGCDRDVEANRRRVASVLAACEADLVVLPEYAQAFDPKSPAADLAEGLDGPFVTLLAAQAAERGCTIVAGLLERSAAGGASGEASGDDGEAGGERGTSDVTGEARGDSGEARSTSGEAAKPFNTVVALGPHGLAGLYRKVHLYDAFGARESAVIAPGDPAAEPLLFDVAGVRVGVMTCFDLRFGWSAERLARAGAQLIVVPAAWAAGPHKVEHWTTLLRARAIEHRCWVAGAGMAGRGVIGHSVIVDPMGLVVGQAGFEPVDDGPVLTAVIC